MKNIRLNGKKKQAVPLCLIASLIRKGDLFVIFLVNSLMGTIFLYSIDTSDISKTTEKVCQMLGEVVDSVGEENVVQVVTDNATNYKLAGEMLM